MASVDTQNNPNDPNNPNNPAGNPNQVQTQGPNQPATSGGAGAVTSTGAANVTGQVVGTNNPSQPFQNVASYLAANAPQSQSLAGQVADSVSKPIQQAQGDIANASQNFMNSVNAGYTPENKDLVRSVASNPVTAAADPNNVAAFQKQLNDTYSGPTDFTATPNYSKLGTEVANAQSLGQSAMTPTGIQTLLQGVEGPTTAGVNNLDTLLLSQNPENFQTIQNAGRVANTTNNALQNSLATQAAQGNAAAQAATANAQAAKTAAGSALTPNISSLASQLQNELSRAQSSANNYNTTLSNNRGTAISELAALEAIQNNVKGVHGTIINDVGNVERAQPFLQTVANEFNPLINSTEGDLNSWINAPLQTVAPTEQTVANAQEYATAQALKTLLGTDALKGVNIDQSTVNQAGTFATPTLPSAPINDSGVAQYLNDLLSLYSPQGQNAFGADNPNASIIQQAQRALGEESEISSPDWAGTADYVAALQRLAAGETA